jgi:hypothetical protein
MARYKPETGRLYIKIGVKPIQINTDLKVIERIRRIAIDAGAVSAAYIGAQLFMRGMELMELERGVGHDGPIEDRVERLRIMCQVRGLAASLSGAIRWALMRGLKAIEISKCDPWDERASIVTFSKTRKKIKKD